MTAPRGFRLTFSETGSRLDYGPDGARWSALDGGWCYGEILSYGGDTTDCFRRVADDWQAGKLDPVRLNGRFVLILHDPARREWQILTDRVGAMHAYVRWQQGRAAAIGSDLAGLAGGSALDWQGIASLCSFGFFIDDRTHYADVKILWPGALYRVRETGDMPPPSRWWGWRHEVDPRRSYADTLATYDHLLRQAVQRCTMHGSPGLPVLPLSGGLDSRSLAAVLPEPIPAYAYGYTSHSPEIGIARQVARARGLPFTAHVIEPYLLDRLPELARVLHGAQDVTQARQASVSDWTRAHAGAVLTGLWGDVWCDQSSADQAGLTDTALTKFHKRGRAWLLDHLCVPHIGTRVQIDECLRESVQTGLAEFSDIADPDFRLKVYKTSRWAFRWSNAALRAFEIGAPPRIPYYDADLIDFFCTVPTDFVRNRRLQIDHLKQYAPDVARLRWQAAGANLYLAGYGRWLRLIGLPRRAAAKIGRAITRQRPIQRNWEAQLLPPAQFARLREVLLSPGLRLHNLMAREPIAALLADFQVRPDAANGYTVSMLLSLAAWFEVEGA